jgi:hypothetical protein
MSSKLKKIKQLIKGGTLSERQKKMLLVGLKKIKECTGNIGGETDITNADNLVAEDEFTAATKPERNIIAKTFDTKADFDSYVNQRRGIEMTSKEQEALITEELPSQQSNSSGNPEMNNTNGEEDFTVNDPIRITKSITFVDDTEGADILADLIEKLELQTSKPTQQDKFFVKYEITDNFGKNETTVIKKLKEGNQYCWTAFSKHESAEDEGKPEGSEEDSQELNNK